MIRKYKTYNKWYHNALKRGDKKKIDKYLLGNEIEIAEPKDSIIDSRIIKTFKVCWYVSFIVFIMAVFFTNSFLISFSQWIILMAFSISIVTLEKKKEEDEYDPRL